MPIHCRLSFINNRYHAIYTVYIGRQIHKMIYSYYINVVYVFQK